LLPSPLNLSLPHRSISLSHTAHSLTLSLSPGLQIWFEVSKLYFMFLFLKYIILVWWLDFLDKLYFMFHSLVFGVGVLVVFLS
jgi:hypothetical protein